MTPSMTPHKRARVEIDNQQGDMTQGNTDSRAVVEEAEFINEPDRIGVEDVAFSCLPNFTPPEISKSPTLYGSQKEDFLSFNLDSIVTGTKRRLNLKAKQLRTHNGPQDDESLEESSLSQKFANDMTSTGIDFALSILNEDINKQRKKNPNDANDHDNSANQDESKPLPTRLAYQEVTSSSPLPLLN